MSHGHMPESRANFRRSGEQQGFQRTTMPDAHDGISTTRVRSSFIRPNVRIRLHLQSTRSRAREHDGRGRK